jgi:hypothetical protein
MTKRGLIRATQVIAVGVTSAVVARRVSRKPRHEQPLPEPPEPKPITPAVVVQAPEAPQPEPEPEPEPKPEPVLPQAPRRPPPRRFELAELRTPILISVAVVVLGIGVWVAQYRERADAATVQQHVALTHPGSTIACVAQAANGSRWDCAIVYRAESACLTVSVSRLGSVGEGRSVSDRCKDPALVGMLPRHVTPAAVAGDVDRILATSGFTCAKVAKSSSRWACERAVGAQSECRTVRVVRWVPLRPRVDAKLCRHVPALRGFS